jgi:hypothetical protein
VSGAAVQQLTIVHLSRSMRIGYRSSLASVSWKQGTPQFLISKHPLSALPGLILASFALSALLRRWASTGLSLFGVVGIFAQLPTTASGDIL